MKLLVSSMLLAFCTSSFATTNCQEKWGQIQVDQTYLSAQGLCDLELRDVLNAITSENHVAVTYKEARNYLYDQLDNIDGKVCSVYSPKECITRKKGNGFNMNIEHTWPQSLGAKTMPAVSDLNHLYLTSKQTNSKRGNMPFCEVEVVDWMHGGSLQGIDINSQDCFEPPAEHKGNVARALFYFAIRYGYFIDETQEAVMRAWHKADPVDAHDIARNQLVFEIQGNRNPFIDHPELVDLIDNF